MASTAEVEQLIGSSAAFFETYPFPVLLLRVRGFGRRDSSIHHASRDESPASQASPKSATPSIDGSDRPRQGSMGEPKPTRASTYTLPVVYKVPESTDYSMDLIEVIDKPNTPPVSAPGLRSMSAVWGNQHWKTLADGQPLDRVLDRHQFFALQEWAERVNRQEARSVFCLRLADRGLCLDLVKTPLPRAPGSSVSHVMLTTTFVSNGPEESVSQNQTQRSRTGRDPMAEMAGEKELSETQARPLIYVRPGLVAEPPEVSTSVKGPAPRAYAAAFESFDYTSVRQFATPQCHILLEELDWSQTSAGPREGWPQEINSVIALVFSSVHQDSVWVGKDMHVIYSNSSIQMVNHPLAFGKPIREIWGPFWNTLGPLIERAIAGEPVVHECDRCLFYHKGTDRYIERYHAISFLPIFNSDKQVIAIYNPTTDLTDRVLAQRRLETTRQLVDQVSSARSSQDFYQSVAKVLEHNPADAPFMLFYSVKEMDANSNTTESATFDIELKLESSVGVPVDHPSAPDVQNIRLRRDTAGPQPVSINANVDPAIPGFLPSDARGYRPSGPTQPEGNRKKSELLTSWPLEEALQTRQSVVAHDISALIDGYPIRQWNALPDTAMVIPIWSEVSSAVVPSAVLILGLNLLRPLDSEYADWIQQIRGHLVTSLGSVQALEGEIRRRMDRDRLEQAQKAWFRGAAHEFRMPLTLITGPLEDLSQTSLTGEQRRSLTLAKRNVNRLTQLVGSFLDFTRMEAGRVKTHFVSVNLPLFISDLASVFAPAMLRHEITFKVVVPPSKHEVVVDPMLLEMAVSNLLSNALKFTAKGQVTLQLDFDNYANISVIDTGHGIPADEIDTVTDWFERSKTIELGISNGAGVGLALVKEIIKLHSGELVIKSRHIAQSSEDHGSIFTARFPLNLKSSSQQPALPLLGSYGREMAKEMVNLADTSGDLARSTSISSGQHTTLDGLIFEKSDKLLVVDDERDVLSYISSIFQPYCTVLEATNPDEAFRLVKEENPNLVLTDVLLHQRTGLELLADIKNDPRTRCISVMCCSAADDDNLRVAALVGGADDFISKPFTPRELLLRVHLHMQMGKRRAKLEMLFKQREQEIAVLSDYCPSGILRTDPTGKVTYVNSAFREAAHIGKYQAIDYWWKHTAPEETARIKAAWTEILCGDHATTNLQWHWATGRAMSGVFIRLDKVQPNMAGIIACINDISYQEEQLQEAERRRIEAEESRWQQELLVDLTSHEIRTPVSAILQCSSLVKENLRSLRDQLRFSGEKGFIPSSHLLDELEDDLEALESIYQCGLVQERIAGDILLFARIQLNMFTLQCIDIDVEQEVRKVLSVFASEARSKKIDIRLLAGSSLKQLEISRITTDPVRLGQVITNLIANAVRFTANSDIREITVRYDVSEQPPTGGSFAIPTRTAPRKDPLSSNADVYLYVSVTDTGPGMKDHEMSGLFQRFHQGNKNIHTHSGGSGLGLFICKQITQLLGGGIDVKSEVGKGSVFRFAIKTTLAARTQRPQLLSSPSRGSSNSTTSIQSPLRSVNPLPTGVEEQKLHVLIVEDNVINQTVLKRQMIKAGLTCAVANNGQEALSVLHEGAQRRLQGDLTGVFQVILMDVEMPVMDGLTAVKHIREDEQSGALPRQLVIALTGNARQGQIEQAFQAGMDDVVIKPYRLPDLLARMREAVSKRQNYTESIDD